MPIVLLLLLGGGGWWWWHRQATASAPQLPPAGGSSAPITQWAQRPSNLPPPVPLNLPVDPLAHAQPLPNGASDGGLAAAAAAAAAANPPGADPSMSDSAFWSDVWNSLNMGGPGTLAPPGAIASLPQSTQGHHVGHGHGHGYGHGGGFGGGSFFIGPSYPYLLAPSVDGGTICAQIATSASAAQVQGLLARYSNLPGVAACGAARLAQLAPRLTA